jgi:hypothetical protein
MKYPGKNRRRNILSYPRAQLQIIVLFAVLAAVYSTTNHYISASALGRVTERVLDVSLSNEARHDIGIIMDNQLEIINIQLMLFTFLSIFMLTLAAVLLSHRLGGPIYHMRKYLRESAAGEGEPRRVKFRKGDFFHDLATAFNEFQEKNGIIPPEEK